VSYTSKYSIKVFPVERTSALDGIPQPHFTDPMKATREMLMNLARAAQQMTYSKPSKLSTNYTYGSMLKEQELTSQIQQRFGLTESNSDLEWNYRAAQLKQEDIDYRVAYIEKNGVLPDMRAKRKDSVPPPEYIPGFE